MSEENISFEELLNNSMKNSKKIKRIMTGKIISVNDEGEIYVDLDYKADGIIPADEYSYDENANPKDELKIGEEITCQVLKQNDGHGNVLLSCKRLKQKEIRDEFNKKAQNDIFEEKVEKANENGLIVNYKGIKIFIPTSLAAGAKDGVVKFKIIENNPKEHKIIGSIKKVVEEEKRQKEEKFWKEVKVGNVYKGVVTSISAYGAFIDVDGVQGLLHISELSWDKNANAHDILKVGQEVKVVIKELDIENKRFNLEAPIIKGEDPWKTLDLDVGDVIKVKIKSFVSFGAFAEYKKGVEGLIHISQISTKHITEPSEELELGEIVNVKVIDVNYEERKIAFSLKDLIGTSRFYSSKRAKMKKNESLENSEIDKKEEEKKKENE